MKKGRRKGITLLIRGLNFLSNLILQPNMLPYEEIYQKACMNGKINRGFYDKVSKSCFTLISDYAYPLSCELLELPQSIDGNEVLDTKVPKKIVVICHGYTSAKCCCLSYAEMYLTLGYSVLVYDHRNHGQSGKAYTTMGYYEKYDLKKVIDWCIDRFGKDSSIITHGESMGAATVLLHLEIDHRVSCAIADCGYSNLKKLIKHQIKQYYHMPSFLMYPVNLVTFLRAGFWYGDVIPIETMAITDTPVLFIHGKEDKFVPTDMSLEMYTRKEDNKEIYLVEGAKHAESYYIDPIEYKNRVYEFLRKYLDNNR